MRHFRQGITSVFASLLLISGAAFIGLESDFTGALGPLSGPNGLIYDLAIAVSAIGNQHKPRHDTFVILIDLDTLETKPWQGVPRALEHPQLAKLANDVLALGARKVGFDIVIALDPNEMKIPGAALSNYDASLSELLNTHAGRIVLGAYPTIAPAQRYADLVGPLGVGVLDLQKESDGIARSVATRLRLPDGDLRLGFAQALALVPETDVEIPAASHIFMAPSEALDLIPNMPASHFETCLGMTEGRAKLAEAIRDRIVIIGSSIQGEDMQRGPDRFFIAQAGASARAAAGTCDAIGNRYLLPVAPYLPGVFLQAAAVESALSPLTPSLASNDVRAFANGVLAAFAIVAFVISQRAIRSVPYRRSMLFATTLRAFMILACALVVFYILVVAAAVLAIKINGIWIPFGHVSLLAGASSILAAMALAAKRDLALADLRLTFGRWLPKPVVDASLNPRAGESFAGQERIISVLFADLRGFTAFCDERRNHPRQVIAALNHKFSKVQTILDKYEGCLDKFDGDAVIAFWNGIEDQSDHAARALAAAVEIVETNAGATGAGELSFKVGVATGFAFVGAYGSPQKTNFSAIGEPMNLAARLESLCNRQGINLCVSEMTIKAAFDVPAAQKEARQRLEKCRVVRLEDAEIKGYEKPIALYTVEALNSAMSAFPV